MAQITLNSTGVASNGALVLQSNGTTSAVTISTAQNVGIGIAPSFPLDVQSTGVGSSIASRIYRSDGTIALLRIGNSTSGSGATAPAFGSDTTAAVFYTNNSEKMRIDSSGNVLVTNAASLGYGTGAGGTVTQATSRTTGVTLSKPTGAITMFSAAGSTTAATFTVTNTLVAATDTIILNQKSGTNLYDLLVTAVAAGSFNITFRTTSGTATDAPVINFALIKGVTA